MTWTPADVQGLPDKLRRAIAPIERLEGWATLEKCAVLASLVLAHKPKLIVESGIFGGRSVIALGHAACEVGARVVGFDPWSAEAALLGEHAQADSDWWATKVDYERIYEGFVRAVLEHSLLSTIAWHRIRGDQAARMFAPASVDFFHQDSNHSELVSCTEVESWRSRLGPHAVWVLDDTDWPTQKRAIGLIQASGFSPLHDTGKYIVFQRTGARPVYGTMPRLDSLKGSKRLRKAEPVYGGNSPTGNGMMPRNTLHEHTSVQHTP